MHPFLFCEASGYRMYLFVKLSFILDASVCEAKKLGCIPSFSVFPCEACEIWLHVSYEMGSQLYFAWHGFQNARFSWRGTLILLGATHFTLLLAWL